MIQDLEHLGAVPREGYIPNAIHELDVAFSRVLLVGEDNPQSSDPRHALFPHPPGCAGHRLAGILGLDRAQHLSLWRTNLCNPTWSAKAARKRAEVLVGLDQMERSAHLDPLPDLPWHKVVLLGAKVAGVYGRVFGRKFEPFTSWRWAPMEIVFATLPHPSGRCHAWNDADAAVRARELIRLVAPGIYGQ